MLYYIFWIIAFVVTKIVFRLKIDGRENIPRKGGILIAADHSDPSDPGFLSMITTRRMYYLARHDAYYADKKDIPDLVFRYARKFAFILRWLKNIPIEKGKNKSQGGIDKAVEMIKNNKVVTIFPEGTTDGGERITDAKRGVARIALKAKCKIIPVGLVNTEGIIPDGKYFFQKYPKVKIKIGKPLYYGKYSGKYNDRKITKLVADDVMKNIAKLCEEARNL